MMASEVALAIAKRNKETTETVGALRLANDADAELRETLDELGRDLHQHLHADVLITFEQCSHRRCQRARQLAERLRAG